MNENSAFTDEEKERNRDTFKRATRRDPRKSQSGPLIIHPFNDQPGDDDAHPDSGVEYAKFEVVGEQDPSVVIRPSGGPESGIPCGLNGCPQITRIVAENTPQEIVEPHLPRPEGGEPGIPEGWKREREKVVALACPRHGLRMQWRESLLPSRTMRS